MFKGSSLISFSFILVVLLGTVKPFKTEKFDTPVTSLTDKTAKLSDGKEVKLESKYGEYTILLVRHAEKVDESNDPDLSDKGKERAGRLADILKAYKAGKVFTTDYKRTKATINPYVLNSNTGMQIYNASEQVSIVSRIQYNKVKSSIVVGHSNSIPEFINKLAGLSLEEFDRSDYGNLIVIKTDLKKKGKVYFFNY